MDIDHQAYNNKRPYIRLIRTRSHVPFRPSLLKYHLQLRRAHSIVSIVEQKSPVCLVKLGGSAPWVFQLFFGRLDGKPFHLAYKMAVWQLTKRGLKLYLHFKGTGHLQNLVEKEGQIMGARDGLWYTLDFKDWTLWRWWSCMFQAATLQ